MPPVLLSQTLPIPDQTSSPPPIPSALEGVGLKLPPPTLMPRGPSQPVSSAVFLGTAHSVLCGDHGCTVFRILSLPTLCRIQQRQLPLCLNMTIPSDGKFHGFCTPTPTPRTGPASRILAVPQVLHLLPASPQQQPERCPKTWAVHSSHCRSPTRWPPAGRAPRPGLLPPSARLCAPVTWDPCWLPSALGRCIACSPSRMLLPHFLQDSAKMSPQQPS